MTSEEREKRERMNCLACIEERMHTEAEWKNHPMAGHGFTKEQGWTHPQLKAEHDEKIKRDAAKK